MLQAKLIKLEEKRANSDPLPPGCAPYTTSNHFKIQPSGSKPKAKRWDRRFSIECLNQIPSPLRMAARAPGQPRLITLGTARPAPQYFPWETLATTAEWNYGVSKSDDTKKAALMSSAREEEGYPLNVAMNYGYSAGSPQALRFVTEHMELIHDPPYDDWECCMTAGTTSAFEIAFRIFCNRGDYVLFENHTYSGTMATAKAQGLNVIAVDIDEFGLDPKDLESKLQNWDKSKGAKPSLLYTIPTGQNPTGTTQNLARRKAIYQIAEEHDLYIIEDDPYYFIQLGENNYDASAPKVPQATPDALLARLPVSYLSLDVSGRVLRMDTTSKILAPGLRCGWVTGSSQVISKFISQTEVGVLSPSGPSQLMVYKLLDETWGHEGFISWLSYLSSEYRDRRNILLEACNRHIPSDVCEWNIPTTGMFFWVKVSIPKHPDAKKERSPEQLRLFYSEVEDNIFTTACENGVLVSKGSWFAASKEQAPQVCFRMTFAAAPENDLTEAIERFAAAVRKEFKLL
ncbi:pyridoxal phosphate-dependent transferase [Dactylonectria estremocensis]|uniref:Pyridoxal phosphate-dependent transferase n=1 Tax=Dactylonectria estremocensis TaxID=1079267 RepID=A0A9P9F095_9HYPO|nr:pyridoxal phosphate-dependent transferase [Dactylonectria estremocensis]